MLKNWNQKNRSCRRRIIRKGINILNISGGTSFNVLKKYSINPWLPIQIQIQILCAIGGQHATTDYRHFVLVPFLAISSQPTFPNTINFMDSTASQQWLYTPLESGGGLGALGALGQWGTPSPGPCQEKQLNIRCRLVQWLS